VKIIDDTMQRYCSAINLGNISARRHSQVSCGTDDPKLATGDWDDVSFLGYPHRHMFHFKVAIDVFHNDRDIEFIQFQRWLKRLYSGDILQLDYKSCEMIADELYTHIAGKYPGRNVVINVSEDGENGCVISYPSTSH
jgi:hypothetical protein